jgi:rSAM/selenodomain-associated transferase 1
VVDKVLVSYAPCDGRGELEHLLNSDALLWHEQCGADLGERLRGALDHAVSLGYGPVIAVGTDSPTLPPSYIETALNALSAGKADIALGPAEDGGYYLIGLQRFAPGLFQDVAWSTAETYQQTVRNAKRLRLRLLELPRWYDIDTFPDLLCLREELCATAGARERVPATYAWLQAHESYFIASR